MKKYKNDIGCIMSFDDDVPSQEVNKRLSWMGKNWVEVKE